MTTEEQKTATSANESTADAGSAKSDQGAAPTVFGIPAAVFVRGGTTSARHDNMMAQQRAEDEERRKQSDADRAMAMNPGDGAVSNMYERNFGTPQQHPVVLLTVFAPKGELRYDQGKPVQILADVFVGEDPTNPGDLALNICCPYCWSRGTPLGRCQFKVRQSNRFWALDPKTLGELVVFEGQVYQSAGAVMDSERIKCPQCQWSFKIHDNKIYEETSG